MTTAELGVLLGVCSSLIVGLLAFLGRNVISDIKAHETRLAEQDKAIAVMNATQLGSRVKALEEDMHAIKSDLRVVRAWVDSQQQNDRHFHRRHGDPKED